MVGTNNSEVRKARAEPGSNSVFTAAFFLFLSAFMLSGAIRHSYFFMAGVYVALAAGLAFSFHASVGAD